MLRILVALDFSDCSRLALGAALDIAAHVPPVEVTVLSVLERTSSNETAAIEETERHLAEQLKLVRDETEHRRGGALPEGVKTHYTVVRGEPAEAIIEQAKLHHADVIVMGTHGRTGLNRLLAGSVAETVVRRAPCSVLTVKPKLTA